MTRRQATAEIARLHAHAVVQESRAGRRYDRAHAAHTRLAESGWTSEAARTWSRAWRAAGDAISARADRMRDELDAWSDEGPGCALGA